MNQPQPQNLFTSVIPGDIITPQHERIELRCACGECRLPFAYLEAGMLVIISYHRHEKHLNRIPLQMALALEPPAVQPN